MYLYRHMYIHVYKHMYKLIYKHTYIYTYIHTYIYIRVVNEVTRGVTGREEFEKISRDIRYDFYKSIMGSTGCRGVLFGHHLGDVQENVISNVMRGCSPLSLSGMGESGISNGVHVWRPLLAHPKEDIFVFAHRYGICVNICICTYLYMHIYNVHILYLHICMMNAYIHTCMNIHRCPLF
jgi:tRNA(Ile)-lysidine synthase TilS/MesJ